MTRGGSPVLEICTPGDGRGAARKGRPYRVRGAAGFGIGCAKLCARPSLAKGILQDGLLARYLARTNL